MTLSLVTKLHAKYTIDPNQEELLDLGLPSGILPRLKTIGRRVKAIAPSDRKFLINKGVPLLINWFEGEYMGGSRIPAIDLKKAFRIVEKLAQEPEPKGKVWRVVRLPHDRDCKKYTKLKKLIPSNKELSSWSRIKEGALDFYDYVLDGGHGLDNVILLLATPVQGFVGSYISTLLVVQSLMLQDHIPVDEDKLQHLWGLAAQEEVVLNIKGQIPISNVKMLKCPT